MVHSRGMPNPLRTFKEYALQKPAEWLADKNVHPNAITLAGAGGQLVSAYLGYREDRRLEEDQREWVYWLSTVVLLASLSADAFDGTVARAHARKNPEFNNPYGADLDGTTDKVLTAVMFLLAQAASLQQGNTREAAVIAHASAASISSSLSRALVELNGGTTEEQSFDPITFAGTHMGRMIFLTLANLRYVQWKRIASLAGVHLTKKQHAFIRESIFWYLALSNTVVTAQRLMDLKEAVNNPTEATEVADSAGNVKRKSSHLRRAKLFGGVLVGALVGSVAEFGWHAQQQKTNGPEHTL